MKNRKELVVAVLATFCLTAALFMVVPTKSQTGSYDARTDVNGDGSIDMADLQAGIDNFMTYGDPTLNVNVTNWPTASATNICYNLTFPPLVSGFSSNLYYANGFGHIHMQLHVSNLTNGQTVSLRLMNEIWNADHTSFVFFAVPGANITVTGPGTAYSTLTVPVPNDSFYFFIASNIAGPGPYMTARYYLTWS